MQPAEIRDDAIVCRCEEVTAGELRRDLVRIRGLLVGLSDGMVRPSDRAPKLGGAAGSGWRPLGARSSVDPLLAPAAPAWARAESWIWSLPIRSLGCMSGTKSA